MLSNLKWKSNRKHFLTDPTYVNQRLKFHKKYLGMTMPIEGMFDQNDLSQIYKLVCAYFVSNYLSEEQKNFLFFW